MSKERNINTEKKVDSKKEENNMVANTALKVENNIFDDFLLMNKNKINSIVPKNPSISRDDEWRYETFWDEDTKRSND